MATDQHRVVKSESTHHSFSPSLVLSGLKPGLYMLMVDVRWNKIAAENSILRKVLVTVSSPLKIPIVEQSLHQGFDILKKVFYDHVLRVRLSRLQWFTGEMDYAFYYFEDSPYKNSWLAYLIT